MGGDHAPDAPVEGALSALSEIDEPFEMLLVGRSAEVEAALDRYEGPRDRVQVVEAPEVVEMDDKPSVAIRGKSKSSISIGLRLQREGNADAFISAGNTGAVMAASAIFLGLHAGIERPAIAAPFPTIGKPVVVLDAGANIDCSARELRGFAHLGALYTRDVLGRPNPTVGLLNIGEEEAKGNASVKEAHAMLKAENPHFTFVGNVEGRDILKGDIDVVVADGFVGNVVLKFYESVANLFTNLLDREMEETVLKSDSMGRVISTLDYSTYGGAPLLGVRGVSIICHGRSSARAIRNAIAVALRSVASDLSQHIQADMAEAGEVV
jgi:glycerol-3-phosphate acyltransferase PlsX